MRATFVFVSLSALWAACPVISDSDQGSGTGGAFAGYGGSMGGDVFASGGATGQGGLTNLGGGGAGGGGGGSPWADAGPGPIDAPMEAAQGDSAVPDSNPHGGASRWIPFKKPSSSSTYYFDKCTWFTDKDGYCVLLANDRSTEGTKTSDVYQTTDGGLTFSLLATIDGGNSAIDGDMDVYVLSPSEIWYTTAFVGMGYSGTIGRSTDGGKTFQSLSDTVHQALADPGATTVPSSPLWRLVSVGGRIWVGSYSSYLVTSADGGATWQRVALPADFTYADEPHLIATRTDLAVRFMRSSMIDLYRWDGTAFAKVEAAFPAPSDTDHGDTWWRASPFGDGIVFIDQRQWEWWGWPFAVSATVDGGKSFQTILTGQSRTTSDVLGLRDALVVNASLAYVCGVFSDTDQRRYSQIRKSIDGGKTWTVVHSEPEGDYTTVVLDATGRAHAMRHVTDYYSNEYSYTGHYVLP